MFTPTEWICIVGLVGILVGCIINRNELKAALIAELKRQTEMMKREEEERRAARRAEIRRQRHGY